MKLESLNSDKFKAFEGFELNNPLAVVGGQKAGTTWSDSNGKSGSDWWYTGRDTRSVYSEISSHFNESGDMQRWIGGVPNDGHDDPELEYHYALL